MQGGKWWGSSSPLAPQNDEIDSSLALRMTRWRAGTDTLIIKKLKYFYFSCFRYFGAENWGILTGLEW